MHAKHSEVLSFDRFGGVLVEAVGPVVAGLATWLAT
jgi:hypothetical protein